MLEHAEQKMLTRVKILMTTHKGRDQVLKLTKNSFDQLVRFQN